MKNLEHISSEFVSYIERAEFKGKLAGTAPDFGFIEDRYNFFRLLTEHGFLEYKGFVNQSVGEPFHTYRVHKDFNYRAAWIRDHSEIVAYQIGSEGNMLVNERYCTMGWPSQGVWPRSIRI